MQYGAINSGLQSLAQKTRHKKDRENETIKLQVSYVKKRAVKPQKDKRSFGESVHPIKVVLTEIQAPDWFDEAHFVFEDNAEENILLAVYLDPTLNVHRNNCIDKILSVVQEFKDDEKFSLRYYNSAFNIESRYETYEQFAYYQEYFKDDNFSIGSEMYRNVIAKAFMLFGMNLIHSTEEYIDMIEQQLCDEDDKDTIKYYEECLKELMAEGSKETKEDIRIASIDLNLIEDADFIFCYLYNTGFLNLANKFRSMVGTLVICQEIMNDQEISIFYNGQSGLILTECDYVLETIFQMDTGETPHSTWTEEYSFNEEELLKDVEFQTKRPQCSLIGFYATEFLQTLDFAFKKDYEKHYPKTS